MKKSLSVVTPTFNEKENIKILVPKILSVFKTFKIDGVIIIVDDRSTDGTVDILKKICSKPSKCHSGISSSSTEHCPVLV